NRPVSFTLWSSNTRHGDALGDLIREKAEDLHAHSPLVTVIRYGKRSIDTKIPVRLVTEFTEVGTLEIWCESQISEHRWRLQFQLRGAVPSVRSSRAPAVPTSQSAAVVDESALERALELIGEVFDTERQVRPSPVDLVGRLEEALN